jgi:RNase H-like domain found in reverse transcriptase
MVVDALDIAMGALSQENKFQEHEVEELVKSYETYKHDFVPISLYSHLPLQFEQNVSAIEKESLSLIRAMKKNQYIILNSRFPLVILTNHKNLE